MRFSHRIGDRGFAASAMIVALLSLGLGSVVLLSTAVDRLLLHPIPVAHPEGLVRGAEKHPWRVLREAFPWQTYEGVRTMRGFEEVAAEGELNTAVRVNGAMRPALAHMVSGNYFHLLGVEAELGRTLEPADDAESGGEVPVVLSHRFWSGALGASPHVIGSTLVIQGQPFIVAGVLPQSFFGSMLDSSPDLWLPFSAQPLLAKHALSDPASGMWFSILARLRPGTTLAAAEGEFAAVCKETETRERIYDSESQMLLEPIAQGAFALHDAFARALRLLLWGLAALLTMMCANVAGLLLARAVRRERETAIRLALGAGRVRLMGRALGEAALLGLAGAAGGLLLAWMGAPLLMRLLPAGRSALPVSLTPELQTSLLAVGVALLLSLLFGGMPAWLAGRVAPERALRRGTATRRPGKLSRALLIAQIGLTVLLLAETGLLLRTFQVLRDTNPGFDPDHLIAFTLDPSMAGTAAPPPGSLPTTLLDQVRQLPGVKDASLASAALMQRLGLKTSVAVTGTKIRPEDFLNTSVNSVSDSFFDTMRMPILAGRGLTPADARRTDVAPVVVNEAFARMLFPHGSPLGRTFGMGDAGTVAKAENVIVGVVGDSKYRSLREPLLPIYYWGIGFQPNWGSKVILYVRANAPAATVIEEVRGTLARLDAQLPFYDVTTMREEISESLWQERLLAVLGTAFSSLSLLMALAGLYGLLAFDASLRTREFGIRTAVGAQRHNVAALLLRDLARIVIPGLLMGGLLCILVGRLVAFALYGVRPLDLGVLSGAAALAVSIALLAAWNPMRRAMRVDPAVVLRDE